MNGVSFASGGAGIFNGTDQTLGQSIPFSEQVDDYIAQRHLRLLRFVGSTKEEHPTTIVDLMANTLKGQLKRLYESGARKFVLTGIGAIGCSGGKGNAEGIRIRTHGINYSYFDTYSIMQKAIRNPSSYGFNEERSCFLGFVSSDGGDARVFVDTLFDGPSDYCVPMN
ncbi:hypothetical protein GQ457_01G006390 [Hibiscus cannabinus]